MLVRRCGAIGFCSVGLEAIFGGRVLGLRWLDSRGFVATTSLARRLASCSRDATRGEPCGSTDPELEEAPTADLPPGSKHRRRDAGGGAKYFFESILSRRVSPMGKLGR